MPESTPPQPVAFPTPPTVIFPNWRENYTHVPKRPGLGVKKPLDKPV